MAGRKPEPGALEEREKGELSSQGWGRGAFQKTRLPSSLYESRCAVLSWVR